ncbi:hypothetical protein CCUS01_02762 [Colletotrichum cuscutae]|uniref:Uncharacterized protein n=1 Tax=Colletotrichum cuscutae TaxID=1209917 RepID=A0AAI9YC72_9PEZI|nr:hypothetical protein CCUS01_02762 [Colletotrichum cuscutae]
MECPSLVRTDSYACMTRPNRWDEILSLKSPTRNGNHPVQPLRTKAEDFSASYHAMELISQLLRTYFAGLGFVTMSPAANGFLPLYTKGSQFLTTLHTSVLFSRSTIPNIESRKFCLENIYQNAATLLSAS